MGSEVTFVHLPWELLILSRKWLLNGINLIGNKINELIKTSSKKQFYCVLRFISFLVWLVSQICTWCLSWGCYYYWAGIRQNGFCRQGWMLFINCEGQTCCCLSLASIVGTQVCNGRKTARRKCGTFWKFWCKWGTVLFALFTKSYLLFVCAISWEQVKALFFYV